MKNRQQTILQNGIYLLIWVILFIIPIFGYRDDEGIRWEAVRMFWARMLPFLLIFGLNNYLLIPKYLVPRRYAKYFAAIGVTITMILVLNHFYARSYFFPSPIFRTEQSKPPIGEAVNQNSTDTVVVTVIKSVDPENYATYKKPRRHYYRPASWQHLMMDYIVAILLIGTNAAICLMFLSIYDRQRMRDMESQTLKAELDYLKAQVNPHFFMNTLNNIHALVDIDRERAKDAIIELSKIMRYVLYDTNMPLVTLRKEIEFVDNFLSLMKMRFSDEVRISYSCVDPLPDVKLPPLMLVAFIENAFKHGISYQKESFVDISIEVVDDVLIYRVANSYFGEVVRDRSSSGVGLVNLRKRLELLFAERGELRIDKTETTYCATLKIPLA